jgi:hypothetical protein
MSSRWVGSAEACAAALLLALALPESTAQAEGNVVREFLRKVIGFSDAQIGAVDAGQVVTKQLSAADKPESAAFGAVRLSGDHVALVRQLRRDVGVARSGDSILEIGRFSPSPRVEDLARLTLEERDFGAARECKPGDCHIKLSRSAMERMRQEIDWNAADARARASGLIKQMLVEYTAAYMRGGTAAMATYADKDRPLETPAEFRRLLAASPYLVEYVPALHRYLEDFPKGSLAGAEDVFYWQKDKFAPKPTVSIFHVTIWTDPERAVAVIASKRIYASHYFQAGLDLLAVVAAPGGGCYLMDLYRARIDPPTGILAGTILGKIRGGIEHGVAERLRAQAALPAR